MIPEELFTKETLKKAWWLHDSFWHAALVQQFGHTLANEINLQVSEKIFRWVTITLLRKKVIKPPKTIQELMYIFKTVWKNVFFDDLYIHEPIVYKGNTAVWTGSRCHAFDSLSRAGMLEGYACGCQALRNGVMKVLRLKPIHRIKQSLVQGGDSCIIEVTFEPAKKSE
ncbi:MAG: hypothetical protein JRH08_07460 [Deltaproteobacteria bacterium]|nr:hypothetical protein [Deltaproteobacteria bacterium]MBW1930259.1 hypothetical protein [Deltaproteobacteria bacterium]MBW2024322.1 hypothetical protein [Deltaproteobacteria bacterium]MBW2125524.1 hypothetical protein [Deltaproteobacteria bacterium]RLB16737.1 MAG: hypothetical protein DRG63_04830 [Deltaproteobacteria bacterium]